MANVVVRWWSAISVAIFGGGFGEENFVRSLVIETRSRAVVEPVLNRTHVVMGDSSKVGPFGIKLSNQAIGILVCTALMWSAWVSHIQLDAGVSSQSFTVGELGAVVKCHTVSVIRLELLQTFSDPLVDVVGVLGFNFGNDGVARLSIDQCHQASTVCRSKHGIALEISEP